jgi:hypothetical protein
MVTNAPGSTAHDKTAIFSDPPARETSIWAPEPEQIRMRKSRPYAANRMTRLILVPTGGSARKRTKVADWAARAPEGSERPGASLPNDRYRPGGNMIAATSVVWSGSCGIDVGRYHDVWNGITRESQFWKDTFLNPGKYL